MSKSKIEAKKTTKINEESYLIKLLERDELPLELPDIENFEPSADGKSPLAKTDWVVIKDEEGRKIGMHEADTMPTWAGSSWYHLRFTDPKNSSEFASKQKLQYWLPVDHYFGGSEHTTVHLLYSRFWHKVLYELGYVTTPEPFQKRTNGGVLLASDGTKMSKSKGNVINPKDKLDIVGADALRLYISFIGPYEATVSWQDGGLIACKKLVDSLFRLYGKVDKSNASDSDKKTLVIYNKMLKKVTELYENQKINVVVAEIMTFVNHLKSIDVISGSVWLGLLQVLAPLAPHITEELWYRFHEEYDHEDYTKSIHLSSWPEYNANLVKDEVVTIAVQINSKVRTTFEAQADTDDDALFNQAKEVAQKWLEGKNIKFFKVVKNKLISIVAD
ncbi:MAG: class I tRNA ligase family protein [Patescibacteria group bacterium]